MMFKTELKIEAVRGEDAYILIDPLIYTVEDGDVIVVPIGFKTNFASVPSMAKWYIDDDSYLIRSPSVVHDFLYSRDSARYGYTREAADKVLRAAMIEQGMRKSQAYFIYYILRVFGGSHWEPRQQ